MKISSRNQFLLELLVLFVLLFCIRYYQIFSVNYANGWDGTFYEMQLTHWLSHGVLHSKNYSLIYWLMKVLVCVVSPLYAYKLVATITAVLFPYLCYVYYRRKTRDKWLLLAITLFLVASPTLLFMSHQFTKNVMGLCVVVLCFLIPEKWYWKLTVLFLGLLTHRFAFVFLALLYTFEMLRFLLDSKLLNYMCFVFFVSTIFVLLLIAIPLKGLFTWRDYQRIIQELNLGSYWVPFQFIKGFAPETYQWHWIIDLLLFHVLLILSVMNRSYFKSIKSLFVLIIVLLIPIWGFSIGSLGYRLWLNAFALSFLLFPVIFSFSKLKWVLLSLSLVLLPVGVTSYNPKVFDPPVNEYVVIVEVLKERTTHFSKSPDIIIAHKGLKEQLLLATPYKAASWIPEKITDRTLRIVSGIEDSDIIKYQNDKQKEWVKLYKGYYLTYENNWNLLRKILLKIKPDIVTSWKNPSSLKPSFLK